MGKASILLLFAVFTVCSFCGKDFKVLNRHSWRCKQKLEGTEFDRNHRDDVNTADQVNNIPNNQIPSNSHIVKCICGKECKGLRGLKSHQRTCRSISSINDEVTNDNYVIEDNIVRESVENVLSDSISIAPELKHGIKLPRSDEDWSLANTYFKASLCNIEVVNNLNDSLNSLHSTVYDYFRDNYGYQKDVIVADKALTERYKSHNKNQLKNELKRLKSINCDEKAIRYVSKLLRSKVNKNKIDIVTSSDNDIEISSNFWSYVKKVFKEPKEVLPSFSESVCTAYFKKTFKCMYPTRTFTIPNWIPKLKPPEKDFDLSTPSYSKICRIIKRMKASGSPCPLDQVSIIVFKRCPYLRTYIGLICAEVLRTKEIPVAWARATTILIYKKGDTNSPENFRPITLEPVTLKIFTSLLRNRVFEYLKGNQYIESHYQKGFTPGMSGTFEHIGEMTHLINHSRLKQRSLTITLIDLRNAFGEVNHNLIQSVLAYHHVPQEIRDIVHNLYTDFHLAVLTKTFTCYFIRINKGVLQGDCFSPLIFNMVVNTFIQAIQEDKFTNFGFRIGDGFTPRNWFQFADDAAAITCLESENQLLLNVFSRWCNWADMLIRVDKCHSFGIQKRSTSSVQFKPKLYLNNLLIKPVDVDEYFTYLGRHFDFKMTNNNHKQELVDTITEHLVTIDRLPLHPRNKLLLYQRYVLSKVSWHLTVADLSVTWVKNNVDNVVSRHIRSWLEIPISGTLDIIQLTKSKFGLGVVLPSTRFTQCQVTFRKSLQNSTNTNIRNLYKITSKDKNVQYDQYVSTKDAIKQIRNMKEDRIKGELQSQSLVITAIWNYSHCSFTNIWSNVFNKLPRNIYSFVNRYLCNSLANASNAVKWGIKTSSACIFCTNTQTLGHVVGGCKSALDEKRYNWRHDSILLNIANCLSKVKDLKVYCDIDLFPNPSTIVGDSYRPDMLFIKDKLLIILELTVGYETNIEKNSIRKSSKYDVPIQELSKSYSVKYINLSMGAIGIIGESSKNIKSLLLSAGLSDSDLNYCMNRIVNVCIRTSYYLFCQRDKEWNKEITLLTW